MRINFSFILSGRSWLASGFGILAVTFSARCSWLPTEGGLHKKNERVASLRAFNAFPIVGKAIAWNGQGDVPNYGLGVQNYWFLTDRFAMGAGLNFLNFEAPGDNVQGGEFETRLRYHFAEVSKFGFFWDLNGGYMWTQSQIPPGGTRGNYTFAFGPGVEMPYGIAKSVLLGAEFHHMSNGRGQDSPVNPSQNEILIWLGHSWTW